MTFFNSFVYDPKRPSELEVKAATPSTPVQPGFHGGMAQTPGLPTNTGGWGRGGYYGKNTLCPSGKETGKASL